MVLKSTSVNDVSVYQVSGTNISRSLPDWIARRHKRTLKNDLEYQNRVELIQDFEFSEASNKIKVTRDGQYAMATGTYKPQIHLYDFANLSLKFERHTDAENIDFLFLTDNWTKSVHLQSDRSIQFQNKGGLYYTTRIPKFGRSLGYNSMNCDLYIGSSGSELYRLNLERGRFLNPFKLETEGVNHVSVCEIHGLLAIGMENNIVEFWDPRSRSRICNLVLDNQLNNSTFQVTTTSFRQDGLNFACGTSNGYVYLYDLRSSEPYVVKDQGYGFEIKKVVWLDSVNTENKVLSSDKRIAKIWDRITGNPYASMEPNVDINDIEHVPGTGMFFTANEGIPMHTYYIPHLGPSPHWCSFLDSITEELEEKPSDTIYSNYRFITRDDVKKLNLSHLIGSNVLRAYMHGYFINSELYDKVVLLANPNAYRDEREREIRRRIDKERESRIRTSGAIQNLKVKVNKELVSRLSQKRGDAAAKKVLADERFQEIFANDEFELNENDYDYKQLNPVQSMKEAMDGSTKRIRALTAAEESDEERITNNHLEDFESSSSQSESESEPQSDMKEARKLQKQLKNQERKRQEKADKDKFMSGFNVYDNDIDSRSVTFDEKVEEERMEEQRRRGNDDILRRTHRGEAELTFIPQKKKQIQNSSHKIAYAAGDKRSLGESGRSKPRHEGRRASRNAFKGM